MKFFDLYEGKPVPVGVVQITNAPWIIFPVPYIMYRNSDRQKVMRVGSMYVVLGKENETIKILSENGIIGWISIEALTEDDEVK